MNIEIHNLEKAYENYKLQLKIRAREVFAACANYMVGDNYELMLIILDELNDEHRLRYRVIARHAYSGRIQEINLWHAADHDDHKSGEHWQRFIGVEFCAYVKIANDYLCRMLMQAGIRIIDGK